MSHANVPPQAVLVLPRLRVQNANAISSPLTHGFPSITAFTGLMWALERKLAQAEIPIPLHLHGVGVICHHHQELTTQGYVRRFNLTRNPVDKDGSTAAIVEEGRIHLEVTLVFTVSEKSANGATPTLVQGAEAQLQQAVLRTMPAMTVVRIKVRKGWSWRDVTRAVNAKGGPVVEGELRSANSTVKLRPGWLRLRVPAPGASKRLVQTVPLALPGLDEQGVRHA